MEEALQIHNTALRNAMEANGGLLFTFVGDAFQAAFEELGKPYLLTLGFEFVMGEYQGLLMLIRQKMDSAAFEAAWEEGRILAGRWMRRFNIL